MEKVKDVFRAAGRFSIGATLSRLTGLLRDVAIAYAFGINAKIAGFMVAFRLANLLRRLLGEGILQTGFVPIYEKLKREEIQKSAFLYRDMFCSILFLAAIITVSAVFLIQASIGSFNQDWGDILSLTQIMVCSFLWISLFGLDAALLQAEKKTFWAGFAPALFNIGMLVFTFGATFSPHPMKFLAFGVVVSFAFQWSVAAWHAKNCLSGLLSLQDWLKPNLFSIDVKQAFSAIGLGMIGIGAGQLNSALDAIFARLADPSGPAFLWYSIRLYQLPIALIGIALSSALLPSLVRRGLDGQEKEDRFFDQILEKGLEFILICAFMLVAFASSGVNLLFGHGNFGPFEVKQTVFCVWAYGSGFIPSALVLLLAQKHYANRSFAAPVSASIFSILFHIALNFLLVFVFHLGAISVAMSTSAGALLNCCLLFKGQRVVLKWPLGTIAVSLFATSCCLLIDQWIGLSRNGILQVAHLSINGLIFVGMIGFYLVKKWKRSQLMQPEEF